MTEDDRKVLEQFRAARIVVGGVNARVDAALEDAFNRLWDLAAEGSEQ